MSSTQQRNRGRDSRNTHQRNRGGPNRTKHGKGSNRSRHPRSRHPNPPRQHRREPANASNEVSSAPPGLSVVEQTSLPPIDEQRQIYAYTRCVGMHCEVEQTGGRTIKGIFHTAHVGAQSPSPQPISLKMLQDMKTGELMTENEHFILNGDTWVQMRVPGLNLLKQDKKLNAKSTGFGTDAEISGRTQIQERTLKACDWLSGAGPGLISGLEDQDPMSESGAGVGKWDQFEANKDLKVNDVTYNENTMSNFYTTSLSPAAVTDAKRQEIERIAQEIEKTKALRPVDMRDDEDRYSAVQRPAQPARGSVAVGNPANVSAIPRKAEGAEKPQRTSETSTKSVQPQVSTNTRAGFKKFQEKCERERQEETALAAAAAAAASKAAASADKEVAAPSSSVNEAAAPSPSSENAGAATPDSAVAKTPPAANEDTETTDPKNKEQIEDKAKEAEEKKPKKIVFNANASSFVFKPSLVVKPPPPAPMQPQVPVRPMYNAYQQHAGYPPAPQHYPARAAYGPRPGHRPPLAAYHHQRFAPASRLPSYPPRGYAQPPHFVHNPGPRPRAMPQPGMHHRMGGYAAGRGPAHNRNMGGMHHS